MISLETALDSAKRFIAKMKGLDIKLEGRAIIEYLDFIIIRKEETTEHYTLFVNFINNIFSSERSSFKIVINKETGIVEDIERIFEE